MELLCKRRGRVRGPQGAPGLGRPPDRMRTGIRVYEYSFPGL